MSEHFIICDGILKKYLLRERIVTVPEGVTVIAEGAFKGCTSIETVILPQSLTDIMKDAFKGCRKLTQVELPGQLKTIGAYAFHRCHQLEQISLPETVTEIGDCAFLYCDQLQKVSMPGVLQIGKQAFVNDVELKELYLSAQLEINCICDLFVGCSRIVTMAFTDGSVWDTSDMISILEDNTYPQRLVKAIVTDVFRMMEIEDRVLKKFLTNLKQVEVPEGIIAIGKSSFFDKKGITAVKLPNSLQRIESRAFRNCISLEQLDFPHEQIEIHRDAFKNCTTLKYLNFFDGRKFELKGLGNDQNSSQPELIKNVHQQILNNFLISGTTLLKYRGGEERVEVPEGIKVIGERAFAGNEAIADVRLPKTIREIRQSAFADCLLLQTIELPDQLTVLGESAFENCVKLLRIQLPQSLERVEKSSFNRCRKLTEVNFGTWIKEIGEMAFYGCRSLKQLTFPDGLKAIGIMAFYQCTGLTEIVLPAGLDAVGNQAFSGSGIKKGVVGGPISLWGSSIFSHCHRLRVLTFADTVDRIGDQIAYDCPSLRYVNLPAAIAAVGKQAFEGSRYLKELTNGTDGAVLLDGRDRSGDLILDDQIRVIAGGAFYNNQKLHSVKFPEALVSIGARAFCNCTALEMVCLSENITALEEGVFAYCSSLQKVTAKGRISRIGERAFYHCQRLTEFPQTDIKIIEKQAFYHCDMLPAANLQPIKIGDQAFAESGILSKWQNQGSLVIINGILIDGMAAAGQVRIPEGVRVIAPYAFAGNHQITGITFPKSLAEIQEGAFFGCQKLELLVIDHHLQRIGKYACSKCSALTYLEVSAAVIEEQAFAYNRALKEVKLGQTSRLPADALTGCTALRRCLGRQLQEIGAGAFADCESLSEISLEAVVLIGRSAFANCDSLTTVRLNRQAAVDAYGFADCGKLTRVDLEGDQVHLDSYAFSGATAITEISVGNHCDQISGYDLLTQNGIEQIVRDIYQSVLTCFEIDQDRTITGYNNRGQIIHIPVGIRAIEAEVFRDAVDLSDVRIPESVEVIGPRAFYGTRWLELKRRQNPLVIVNDILVDGTASQGTVVIPPEIKLVSGWAFANCYEIERVVYRAEDTRTEEYAFRNCIHLKEVEGPDGRCWLIQGIAARDSECPEYVKQIFLDCLNCFKTDQNHQLIECTGNIPRLTLVRGITGIGDQVFKDSNLLTEITLTADVKVIGRSAFEDCKWLTEVRHGIGVEQIGKKAFSGCLWLEQVEFSDSLKFIGVQAFEHCTNLKEIIIPEGVTEIPDKAFYRCKSLTKINLPSTIKRVGQRAFAFCEQLQQITIASTIREVAEDAFYWCPKLLQPVTGGCDEV